MYYVKLTVKNREKILAKVKSKEAAYKRAEKAQKKYSRKGVDGIISVYQTREKDAMPLRMIYEFWDVAPCKR